jgi:hypothetical protein
MANAAMSRTIRVKRKDFVQSKSSRLCAKHFTNEQFAINPLFGTSVEYKMKKLAAKPDAEPTVSTLYFVYNINERKYSRMRRIELVIEVMVKRFTSICSTASIRWNLCPHDRTKFNLSSAPISLSVGFEVIYSWFSVRLCS